jgi:hypothetical protein
MVGNGRSKLEPGQYRGSSRLGFGLFHIICQRRTGSGRLCRLTGVCEVSTLTGVHRISRQPAKTLSAGRSLASGLAHSRWGKQFHRPKRRHRARTGTALCCLSPALDCTQSPPEAPELCAFRVAPETIPPIQEFRGCLRSRRAKPRQTRLRNLPTGCGLCPTTHHRQTPRRFR